MYGCILSTENANIDLLLNRPLERELNKILIKNITSFKNAFENVGCKMVSILLRSHSVKLLDELRIKDNINSCCLFFLLLLLFLLGDL